MLLFAGVAVASAAPGANANAASGDAAITVDNSVAFLSAAPGARITHEVVVKNSTPFRARFDGEVFDITRTASDGERVRYAPAASTPRSAAPWLDVNPITFDLAARTQRVVTMTFDVPASAEAGGRYVALVFTARQLDAAPNQELDLQPEVPALVLLTVEGDLQRSLRATLTPLDRWRWTGGSVSWNLELRNDGDVHEVVSGIVRVDGVLASPVTRPVDAGVLLPGESRTQRIDVEVRAAPDLLEASADIRVADAATVDADAPRVVVLPWWLLALLAALASIIVYRMRRRDGDAELLD